MTRTAPRPPPSAIEGPGVRPLLDGQRATGEQLLVKVFVVVPLLALLAAVPLAWGWGLSWTDIGLAVLFYFLSGLGITVGFHRHFTHRAFKATRALKIGLAVAGSMAFQGSIISWVADHRRHHAFTDKEGDTNSPWRFGTSPAAVAKGFVYAHLSWLFVRDNAARFAPDLLADPHLRRVHRLVAGQPGRAGRARWGAQLVVVGCGDGLVLGGVGASGGAEPRQLVDQLDLSHDRDPAVHRAGPFDELLAAGDRVDGRVVAHLPPRRSDVCAARGAAWSAGHVGRTDCDLRDARVGLRHPLADPAAAGPPHRATARRARRPGVTHPCGGAASARLVPRMAGGRIDRPMTSAGGRTHSRVAPVHDGGRDRGDDAGLSGDGLPPPACRSPALDPRR